MAQLNQQLTVNGTVLSNNDPDLVIKLDDHPVVQISSIQPSTITYSFKTDVDTPQTYNLNLTFTYKGKITKVIPLVITHNPKPIPLVITDVPITAAMWQRGNNIPFTAKLNGTDVTSQLTNIALIPNNYVKADPNPGTKQLWSVEASNSTAVDVQTEFSFNYTYEGKVKTLKAKGTYKLPAWDGKMMWVKPTTTNDPKFTSMRIKIGTTATINLMPYFRGAQAYDNAIYRAEYSDTANGLVQFGTGATHWSTGLPVNVKGLKVGTAKVKFALVNTVPFAGYPDFVENSTMVYWTPTIEVYDDVLEAASTTTDVSGKKGTDVTFNMTLKWNSAALATNASGVAITFEPTGYLTFKSATANTVTATLTKDVPYTQSAVVNAKATYQTKSAAIPLNVTTVNDVVSMTLASATTKGGTNDTITLTPTVLYNNQSVPINDATLSFSVAPTDKFSIVSRTATTITLKVTDASAAPSSYTGTLTVTRGTLTASQNFTHSYTVRPTMEVTPVTASIMDTGTAPFRFTVNGEAITPTYRSVSVTNDYVNTTDSLGAWKVVKADDTQHVENVIYNVGITVDGVNYDYSQAIAFTIKSLGSTVTATPVVDTGDMVLNKQSQVVFSLSQILNGQQVTLDPVFENVTVTGEATYVNIEKHPDNAGEYVLTVKGTGNAGNFTLNARLHNRVNGQFENAITYPFSVNFKTAKLASSTITMSMVGSDTLVPSQQNTLTVALKYGTNNAVVGATARTVTVAPTPSTVAVIASNGTTLTAVDDQPGQYTLTVDAGHMAGTGRLSLIVMVDGAQYTVDNSLVYTNPGTTVNTAVTTANIPATNDAVTEVRFSLAQARFNTTDYTFPGATFKSMSVTGAAKAIDVPVAHDSDFTVNLTSNGTEGQAIVNGIVVDADNHEFPFSFVIATAEVTPEPVITEKTSTMSLNLWEAKPVTYKVMAGNQDITAGSTVSNASAASVSEHLEFVQIADGSWGFKAIKADSVENVVLTAKVNVTVNYGDSDHVLPIEFEVTILANNSGISANRFNVEFM